jgi:hypothetical protein
MAPGFFSIMAADRQYPSAPFVFTHMGGAARPGARIPRPHEETVPLSDPKFSTQAWIKFALLCLGIIAFFCGASALVVKLTWNAVLPDLFGIPSVSFWQAALLCLLFTFLSSGFGLAFHLFKAMLAVKLPRKFKSGKSRERGRTVLKTSWEALDHDERAAVMAAIQQHQAEGGHDRRRGRGRDDEDHGRPGRGGKPFRRDD